MPRNKVLIFDFSANYGHFKVIYATTSALTYPIPSKTAIYGLIGNIIGLSNRDNSYLEHFTEGQCKIALQVLNPITTQRLHINWSSSPGAVKSRKPTLVEHTVNPSFRVYVSHRNEWVYEKLKEHLESHTSVYTPCMGLANLLANFEYIGEGEFTEVQEGEAKIHSIIPIDEFVEFLNLVDDENFICSMSQYTVEMTTARDVTKRAEVLFDRKGLTIRAKVRSFQSVDIGGASVNIILH